MEDNEKKKSKCKHENAMPSFGNYLICWDCNENIPLTKEEMNEWIKNHP